MISSNCTFMELKSRYQAAPTRWGTVLIVPLWNWNGGGSDSRDGLECSNCTFMELKYEIIKAYEPSKEF